MAQKINILQRLRFELQWDQVEMAEELNVSQAMISMLERGQRRLTSNMAVKLNKITKEKLGNVGNGQAA
ncbi:MAG: helix-turn-helix transcriptional regulator [Hyphomicrobiaceae bacterium]|nr:helix-turn-helix transcriptional regulator [Hyphomicrobiaceae bacterium]